MSADPEENDRLFQLTAEAADRAVWKSLEDATGAGLNPAALASGALMAVIRYHLQHASVPATERAMLKVIIPAIGRCIASLTIDTSPRPQKGTEH